jgi:hypothetical protein
MPKRTDIKSILLIGSGPMVIGRACELEDSSTLACRTVPEKHYRPGLVDRNPTAIHCASLRSGPSGLG